MAAGSILVPLQHVGSLWRLQDVHFLCVYYSSLYAALSPYGLSLALGFSSQMISYCKQQGVDGVT